MIDKIWEVVMLLLAIWTVITGYTILIILFFLLTKLVLERGI